MNDRVWSYSEDSFLSHFCRIQRNEITDFYVWDAGLLWPKFTFVRLHSLANFTMQKLLFDLEQFIKLSNIKDEDLIVKINDSYLIPEDLNARLTLTDSRLAYLSFSRTNKLQIDDCQLFEAITEDDLKIFWNINSSGRVRQNPFGSPLWPIVKSSQQLGTKYFYLLYKDRPVTCAAIDQIDSGWNLWGLATLESEQNRGFMGETVRQLLEKFHGQLFAQVNHTGVTHKYFLKNCQAKELASESWYRLI